MITSRRKPTSLEKLRLLQGIVLVLLFISSVWAFLSFVKEQTENSFGRASEQHDRWNKHAIKHDASRTIVKPYTHLRDVIGGATLTLKKLEISTSKTPETSANEPSRIWRILEEADAELRNTGLKLDVEVSMLHDAISATSAADDADASGCQPGNNSICIAIPSAPRVVQSDPSFLPFMTTFRLLRFLSLRRLKIPSAVHYQIKVIVQSTACSLTPADVASLHLQALKYAAEQADNIEIQVLGPVAEICALTNMTFLGEGEQSYLQWRAKENADFVNIMEQCQAGNPTHILFLEDDTMPVLGYDLALEHFIEVEMRGKDWAALSLYYPSSMKWHHRHKEQYDLPCCTQALLFNASVVPALLEHVAANFAAKPIDWLIQDHFKRSALKAFVHVPSLFQHVGSVSTYQHKVLENFHLDSAFDVRILEHDKLVTN